ncbi:DDE-domain-containing protein [Dacryopinax primogenitus]|uniref:DDE-domain-containing protein n=1 Tax=Dacryopinax primogenitus (strain DJM 731) TaxID=1858805 RepID=M5G4Q6_DACPD|nr:DDE-domain-containing protein [Dacryopinax primogenitus]EJU05236.1 DDE-domain-containing protein [Dacryopinax primogenitus]
MGLREFHWHGEAGSVPQASVEAARTRIRKITDQYELQNIFNMDEAGLFGKMPPDRGLANSPMSGLKAEKTRLTYPFTTNANGTERMPPYILGHAQMPRCLQNCSGTQLGFDYHWNQKAWMTSELFNEYLKDINDWAKE